MADTIDVVGIGNAIVDVISRTDDAFLKKHAMDKGAMILIDADQAETIYAQMGPGVESSGGSAANTIAGIASLGGACGFIGKVRDDQLGNVFTHDIRSLGAEFTTPAATDGPPTARCLVLVTPDGQRTMNTFLGACQGLGPDDVEEAMLKRAKIVYMEGYLWDPPAAKDAFVKAMDITRKNGGKAAFTLSDSFCVDRYRSEFQALLNDGKIDILFANEAELKSLYETDDFDAAVEQVAAKVEVAVCTRSEKGGTLARGSERVHVPAEPTTVEDTTGAGDLYAAGVLTGLSRGLSLEAAGRMGAIAAAEVISHLGPRPEHDLKKLVAQKISA
ncbi:fructokinase [Rhodothalassium salexigens DSM 2132]|uniref:Fructokinase n=1 Tax=Rhodothalassium salexigens DSM 2132 TaxID=1188247 RepID=A0A4R2PKT3_RHOSA|nr:adenosine kinase [Rhodothalassium salexigens]MBB4211161.1 sugar/nucleoside kinase (ribokinase family) [Rhodothalassium salexigens DSM 2132]TCP36183.1 fructokinase [Rhodothalassium salexigens DSM 2132]